jgi:hypothetical protein
MIIFNDDSDDVAASAAELNVLPIVAVGGGGGR